MSRFPKQVSVRKAAGTFAASLLIVSAVLYYVWAATPSSTFWLAPGVYPGAPDYTVWREGNTYFAKDANGAIKYSGSNASEVIQNAIDALSRGNIYVHGSIVLLTQLVLNDNIGIVGDRYGTQFILETDICGINITNVQNVLIRDIMMNVTVASYSNTAIFIGGYSRDVTLEHLYLLGKDDQSGVGITITSNNNGVYRATFNTITIYYFATAILLQPQGTSGWINSNGFSNIYCWYPRVGIQFNTDNAGQDIDYNVFFHVEIQADANFQRGININTTTGDVWYNKFYGVTIFDVPASGYSIYIDESLNEFFGVDAYVKIGGSAIYGSTIFSSGWFKLRYMNPDPDPGTLGWGLPDRGIIWYSGVDNCVKYWNGTDIVSVP